MSRDFERQVRPKSQANQLLINDLLQGMLSLITSVAEFLRKESSVLPAAV